MNTGLVTDSGAERDFGTFWRGRAGTRKVSGSQSLTPGRHFSFGSRASRTPSPRNVNDSIVSPMAMDGNTQRCQ
jgi:hypothetical protein